MKFISCSQSFEYRYQIDLGHTDNDNRDGGFNDLDNPKDWPVCLLGFRFKYALASLSRFPLRRYPHGFYFSRSGGTYMCHVRVCWLQLVVHWASWWSLRNGISV